MKNLIYSLLLFSLSCGTKPEDEPIDCGGCFYETLCGESDDKKACFRIAYLTQEQKWKLNSETHLMDSTLAVDAIERFMPIFPGVKNSLGVIAVGTASQEGLQKDEEPRADERADVITAKLREMTEVNQKELYKLNLGQFSTKVELTPEQTDYQRRMILIGILEKDSRMDNDCLKEALRNAMSSSKGLNFKTFEYSKFELTKMN